MFTHGLHGSVWYHPYRPSFDTRHALTELRPMTKPLEELLTTDDFEEAAKNCLPEANWDYISGGESDTIQRNRRAFGPWLFRPRVLRDVSDVDLRCELFGAPCGTPIYLSCLAKGRLVDRSGEATFDAWLGSWMKRRHKDFERL
eukprot:s2967_g2.t1